MAHIDLGLDEHEFPGISGPMRYRPETAKPLNELAEVLLRGPHTLSRGERELIAAYVSGRNECTFCCSSHSAFAAAQLDGGYELVDRVVGGPDPAAPISAKLHALLAIAGGRTGRRPSRDRRAGRRCPGGGRHRPGDPRHGTDRGGVLQFNRYVDGLATFAPRDREAYAAVAERIVTTGYGVREPVQ